MEVNRQLIAAAIELLIDVLDRLDSDPDLEEEPLEPEPRELDRAPAIPDMIAPRQITGGHHG